MTRYEVPIIYRGLSTFIVEANSEKEAAAKAESLFRNGEPAPVLGNEWEEIDSVGEVSKVEE